ncbi:MAG: hypothetical protein O3B29_06610 [Proteobacteria bacterium]|nr:hypothetical protein [Pseudomonadota bacterium]
MLFAVEQALRSYKSFVDANTSTTLGTEENEDWVDWIADTKTNFDWMALFIDGWLEADADSSDSEFFQCTSAEVLAMQYLRRLGEDTLEKLGVYFVEGEYPGSSFNCAVLREDVDYANQVARDLGLCFRFCDF